MSVDDRQVGGQHYKCDYQHWDFIRDVGMSYLEAQVVRYVTRHKDKGQAEDLDKAIHFLQKLDQERSTAVEQTLKEYASANNLDDQQERVIALLMGGRYGEAMAQVQATLVVDYGAPGSRYVDQD